MILGINHLNWEQLIKGGEHELRPLLERFFEVKQFDITDKNRPAAFEPGGTNSAGGQITYFYCTAKPSQADAGSSSQAQQPDMSWVPTDENFDRTQFWDRLNKVLDSNR